VGNAETAKKNPEENRQDILARVEQAMVSGEVRISNVMVPIADIIALSPGDVLLLDSSIGQGVELLFNGKTIAYGLMSTCQGRKAIQITELATQARKN
jgi:flagellar motor switch/type III secretory pathway protein FliN